MIQTNEWHIDTSSTMKVEFFFLFWANREIAFVLLSIFRNFQIFHWLHKKQTNRKKCVWMPVWILIHFAGGQYRFELKSTFVDRIWTNIYTFCSDQCPYFSACLAFIFTFVFRINSWVRYSVCLCFITFITQNSASNRLTDPVFLSLSQKLSYFSLINYSPLFFSQYQPALKIYEWNGRFFANVKFQNNNKIASGKSFTQEKYKW